MVNLPQPVKIDPKDHAALIELNGKIGSVNQMIQMFQQNAEARIHEHQRKVQAVWEKIARDNPGLDLNNVVYVPVEDGTIVPVQMRLNPGRGAQI